MVNVDRCQKCKIPIHIERWATIGQIKKGNNKGEQKVPVWRHIPQVAPGGMCGDGTSGTTATPPPGKVYKE